MIDVIVPVYGGEWDVRRCLASVWSAKCSQAFELVVIDDCSPEPVLSAWLDELATKGRITLLRNQRNLGFVGSVNRGMALHTRRDVVLLNSDTEVADGWLDRLSAAAVRHPDAATLTPFSNNATICSYPYEGWAGEVPGTLGLAGLDALFATTLDGVAVDLPTGVGFCMYIRRAALDALGTFDEAAFGRGYGEENDFCRRAAKAGWRNLLCADVFVYHHGGVSFGADRLELMRAGGQALLARHPEYDDVVRAFIVADPFAPLRAAVDDVRRGLGNAEARAVDDEQRIRVRPAPVATVAGVRDFVGIRHEDFLVPPLRDLPARVLRPVVLHVSHGWGGGIERWVRDYVAADAECWNLLLRSRSGRNEAGVRLELVDPAADDTVLLAWELEEPIGACATSHAQYRRVIREIASGFALRALIVSSLIGHALDVFEPDVPTVVVLHDLFPFCPALFGYFGIECRNCGEGDLQRCLDSNPLNVFWHQGPVARWTELRAAYARCLADDRVRLVAPSRSVADRYAALFPALGHKPVTLIAHGLSTVPAPLGPRRDVAPREGGRLRLLVPGRLSPHKGLALMEHLLPALADVADVLLLGCGDFGAPFADMAHVQSIPDYAVGQLAAHVAVFSPDCALLASSLPETFSYTLSEMQALGIPVVATALGAFAERLAHDGGGLLVPVDVVAIERCLRRLAADRETLLRMADALRARPVRRAQDMAAEYCAMLGPSSQSAVGADGAGAMLRTSMTALGASRGALRDCTAQLEQAWRERDAALARCAELERVCASGNLAEASLRSALQQAIRERDALLHSTSWRVMRPLRGIVTALRRVADRPQATESGAQPEGAARPFVWRAGDPLSERTARALGALSGWGAQPLPGSDMDARFGCGVRLAREGTGNLGGEALPLVGDWDGVWAAACAPAGEQERGDLRRQQRIALGVPDEALLVIGLGRADACSGLLDFAKMAMQVSERRNGCVFVWLGGRDEAWMRARRVDLSLPISLRRMFLVDEPDFEPWLLAADVYLGCRDGSQRDAGVLEALACALPVIVDDSATLPVSPEVAEHDLSDGRQLADRLLSRLGERREPRHAVAEAVRRSSGGTTGREILYGLVERCRGEDDGR